MQEHELIAEGYYKLESYSPFYYAISNNMQGNIYLLIQKGFSHFSALSESIKQGKYNLFISLLDIVDENTLKDLIDSEGKNLMHVLANHAGKHNRDEEKIQEIYDILVSSGVDIEAQDNEGRIPLHYAYHQNNEFIAEMLLISKSHDQIVEILNMQDKDNITVFGMIFKDLESFCSINNMTIMTLRAIGKDIKKLNPFIRFHKMNHPYTHRGCWLLDKEMIHPLILLDTSIDFPEDEITKIFDFTEMRSQDFGMSWIDQAFKFGRVGLLSQPFMINVVSTYLQDPKNIEFIERCLSCPIKFDAYQYLDRIIKFIYENFEVFLNLKPQEIDDDFCVVKEMVKANYDFERDSEEYLEKQIPILIQQEGKPDWEVDSNEFTEKHCVVVQDTEESKYYFDAMMKKVDIKKYYYGLDNFYVLQILFDKVKKVYILWTRWGRSGSYGQYQRTPFGRVEDARDEFIKIFKQKTGWAWKDIQDYVKKEKKYEIKRLGGRLISKNDLQLKFSNADFQFEKLMIPIEDLSQKVEMKNPAEFQKFLKALVDDRSVYTSLKYQNYSNAIMLLAPQDKATIDEGIKILEKIKKILQDSDKHRLDNNFGKYSECIDQASDLNSEYMEVIPKINPTTISAILNVNQVNVEMEMLKKVYSLSYSVRSVLGAYLQQDMINPYDYILGTLNVTLNVVDLNSKEADLILHYLNSSNSMKSNLRNIMKVDDLDYSEEQNELFHKTKNHMMLWHGTSSK